MEANTPMRLLAIDPATNCGFAHSCGDSGVWRLGIRKDESSGMRWIRLRGKLNEIHAAVGVDVIVFEASRNLQHGNAVRVAAGLQATIETWCVDNGVEYRGYSPSEVKKFATGKGNAKKDAMMAAAQKRWPNVELVSDDHADALWLLELASAELGVTACGEQR